MRLKRVRDVSSFLGGEITFPDINQSHKLIVIPSKPFGRHPKPPQDSAPTMIKHCQSATFRSESTADPSTLGPDPPITAAPQRQAGGAGGVFKTGSFLPLSQKQHVAFHESMKMLVSLIFISLLICSFHTSEKHLTCPTCQTGGVLIMKIPPPVKMSDHSLHPHSLTRKPVAQNSC